MLEKSEFHGPVMNPDSVSLETGEKLLKAAIENDKFIISININAPVNF